MTTVHTRPQLLYELSTRPPIPFPVHPSYPIRLPTRDLPSAYLESLWTSDQRDQISLESFARLLLSLKSQQPASGLEALLRGLVRPLHDFDKRWRSVVPDVLEEDEDEQGEGTSHGKDRGGLLDHEKDMIYKAYERWEAFESKRLEEEKAKRKAKGKEKAKDQDRMIEDEEEHVAQEEEEEPKAETWVSDREVYETRLQALLLLTLMTLSPTDTSTIRPSRKGKGRKKKDPERDSTTLDPALLLDFLTDRLQIWRVMQGLTIGEKIEEQEQAKGEVVETRDTVQDWWADIVEPLYRNNISEDVLAHHRVKLFPDTAIDSRTTTQAALNDERSLMSLDKSARRRDLRESQAIVSESPTMKRLLSVSSLPIKEKGGEVFKMPLPPSRRNGISTSFSASETVSDLAGAAAEVQESTRSRLPRKQERSRPLPRGDSSTTNMRDMLKRREVSLAKKASATGVKKPARNEGEMKQDTGRKRKRKSASPQKLAPSSRSTETLTLVPDTPAKPVSKLASFKKPFSRAISLPSFAALGAAFRPGAPDPASVPLPFGIPPPPILATDRQNEMEWESSEDVGGSDEEDWLSSRKVDFRAKGGRSRDTSGSADGDGDEVSNEAAADRQSQLDTPKKPPVVLVADTPN